MRDRFTIGARLWVVAVAAGGCIAALSWYAVRVLEARATEERQAKVRAAVETATAIVARYGSLAESGKLSREEAQAEALKALAAVRYQGSEYFWVNDLAPRMVMHPTKPELDGKDLADHADPTGKRLFVEMVRVARGAGGGFVDYRWPKPGFTEPVRKVSFVKLYQPWGWIVGSGLYLDDLDAAVAGEARRLLIAAAVVTLFVAAAGAAVARDVRREVAGMCRAARRLEVAVQEGRLSERADAAAVGAEFRGVLDGMNRTLEAFVAPQRLSAEYLAVLARGDVPPPIAEDYRGDFAEVKRNWNALIEVVEQRGRDVDALLQAAQEGRLGYRADAARYAGANGQLIASVNGLLDAMARPVDDAVEALGRLARGDLTARVDGSYRGEFARMKEAIDGAAAALQQAIAQVAESVEQVSGAAAQIASSSQAVAAGASEQAASLEETNGSLEAMASATRLAAEHAAQANALAATARGSAEDGAGAMQQMSGAMAKVRASAEGTSQIIRDINDIAFQTNLLALNAAVEAARAGDAGRGFAVVAEEVRSLALRSKEAASKTEALIRESVRQAGEGEAAAAHVGGKLAEIVGAAQKVSVLVAEMAASSQEQAHGIEQVTLAVAEVGKVTQQNAASSEESSSAAQELSGQSDQLAALVGGFTVRREGPQAGAPGTAAAAPLASREVPAPAGRAGQAGAGHAAEPARA